jgi:hypothetical protein
MIISMSDSRVKGAAKRMRKILRGFGLELSHMECLEITVRLLGFENWQRYCHRGSAPFSPFDENLAEAEFVARDEFQMKVLATAGLGSIAPELLDRVNPTGSWCRKITPYHPPALACFTPTESIERSRWPHVTNL